MLAIHLVDLFLETLVDDVALQFAVGGEESVFRREYLLENREIANLAIVWQFGVDHVQRRLDRVRVNGAGGESKIESAADNWSRFGVHTS